MKMKMRINFLNTALLIILFALPACKQNTAQEQPAGLDEGIAFGESSMTISLSASIQESKTRAFYIMGSSERNNNSQLQSSGFPWTSATESVFTTDIYLKKQGDPNLYHIKNQFDWNAEYKSGEQVISLTPKGTEFTKRNDNLWTTDVPVINESGTATPPKPKPGETWYVAAIMGQERNLANNIRGLWSPSGFSRTTATKYRRAVPTIYTTKWQRAEINKDGKMVLNLQFEPRGVLLKFRLSNKTGAAIGKPTTIYVNHKTNGYFNFNKTSVSENTPIDWVPQSTSHFDRWDSIPIASVNQDASITAYLWSMPPNESNKTAVADYDKISVWSPVFRPTKKGTSDATIGEDGKGLLQYTLKSGRSLQEGAFYPFEIEIHKKRFAQTKYKNPLDAFSDGPLNKAKNGVVQRGGNFNDVQFFTLYPTDVLVPNRPTPAQRDIDELKTACKVDGTSGINIDGANWYIPTAPEYASIFPVNLYWVRTDKINTPLRSDIYTSLDRYKSSIRVSMMESQLLADYPNFSSDPWIYRDADRVPLWQNCVLPGRVASTNATSNPSALLKVYSTYGYKKDAQGRVTWVALRRYKDSAGRLLFKIAFRYRRTGSEFSWNTLSPYPNRYFTESEKNSLNQAISGVTWREFAENNDIRYVLQHGIEVTARVLPDYFIVDDKDIEPDKSELKSFPRGYPRKMRMNQDGDTPTQVYDLLEDDFWNVSGKFEGLMNVDEDVMRTFYATGEWWERRPRYFDWSDKISGDYVFRGYMTSLVCGGTTGYSDRVTGQERLFMQNTFMLSGGNSAGMSLGLSPITRVFNGTKYSIFSRPEDKNYQTKIPAYVVKKR